MQSLKLAHPLMRGPAVKRLQEMCDLLGFDTGPNDGVFGVQTRAAVLGVQDHIGIDSTGVCDAQTWEAIVEAVNGLDRSVAPDEPADVPEIADIRDDHPHPKLYKCGRSPADVDSIVLHQTGCKMPTSAAGWSRLNAHIGITSDGLVVFANDFLDWIWHAQGLSQRSIGVEVAGNFPGLTSDPKTLWKGGGPAATLTPEMIAGAEVAGQLISDECKRLGITIRHIFTHRQSKDTRAADPGQEIWQRIAVPWMGIYGYEADLEFCCGSGKPIPREWQPQSELVVSQFEKLDR